jgi:hypothetical protein
MNAFNQDVTINVKTTYNEYGEPTLLTKTIKARLQPYSKQFTDNEGKTYLSKAICYCNEELKIGDLINNYFIMDASDFRNLDGTNNYFKYILR